MEEIFKAIWGFMKSYALWLLAMAIYAAALWQLLTSLT